MSDTPGVLDPIWQKAKWVVLGLVAALAAILAFILRGFFDPPTKNSDRFKLPDPPKPLTDAVARADEQALVVKATAKAASDEQKARVAAIMQIDDGKERRSQLADWLRGQ